MQINEYQEATLTTAIYPDAGAGTIRAFSYVGLGLAGECGEFCDKLKKVVRDDDGFLQEDRRQALIGELGDVLWYASQAATELGVDLEEVAIRSLDKLLSRKERGVLKGSGDNR